MNSASPPQERQALVVCTCGVRRPEILSVAEGDRCFDLAIINHAPNRVSYRDVPAEYHFEHPGWKWQNLKRFFDAIPVAPCYPWFWLPDDDIRTTAGDLCRLFAIATGEKLALCQPSLSSDSHVSWDITRHRPARRLRRTNFVELMCPLFSADALAICLPSFEHSQSGWGLDFVWPHLLGNSGIAIVDEVQVRHTRPVRSGNWKLAGSRNPGEEWDEVLQRYGLNRTTPMEVDP